MSSVHRRYEKGEGSWLPWAIGGSVLAGACVTLLVVLLMRQSEPPPKITIDEAYGRTPADGDALQQRIESLYTECFEAKLKAASIEKANPPEAKRLRERAGKIETEASVLCLGNSCPPLGHNPSRKLLDLAGRVEDMEKKSREQRKK